MTETTATFEKSQLVGFRHGFFTKQGGFSKPPYAGLNVTTRVGDDKKTVEANRALALSALNLKIDDLAFLDELEHGSRVVVASDIARGKDFDGYDVIMTNQAGVTIGVSTADCPPVLLASEKDGAIALVHAGWRGLDDQVVGKAVEAMVEEYHVDPSNITAVIGPGIGVDNYEFGGEAKDIFNERYIIELNGKPHIDLNLLIEDQLVEAGVGSIDKLNIDTYDDERFYSVRREGSKTGRFISIASL